LYYNLSTYIDICRKIYGDYFYRRKILKMSIIKGFAGNLLLIIGGEDSEEENK